MKLIDTVNDELREVSALGAICGIRCDAVVIDEKDMSDLLGLSPMKLQDRLVQIRCRMRRERKKELSIRLDNTIKNRLRQPVK